MVRPIFAFLLGLLVFQRAAAQPTPSPGDAMIEKYLAAETDKLSRKFADGAKTLAEWQKKRPRLYQEYMDMLGLWPLPEKTPLKATITGTLEKHGVVIEKIHFQSKPGLYVTANLYRPKMRNAKLPAIVYVCGHSGKGRDGNKTAFQDHGLWFANNGYVCLILDTLQLGEIPGVHHGTYGRPWGHLKAWGETDAEKMKNHNRFWWYSAGYTPAGVECWNGVRAIDYLVTRPDVDPDKIGVTGISGGGAATFWIAAADERVKVAVPVSGMSDLEFYVKNKGVNGHCDCMFLYNTYQWDWTTIAALVAPRPLLFANSDNDPIFPMDANRRIMEKLRKLYKMHEKPELVDEYVSKGGHDYRPDLRIAIFKFMNQHLKGDTKTPVEDTRYDPIPGKELRVFATDDDLPKDRINHRIDETFVPREQFGLPREGEFVEWKEQTLKKLKDRSFREMPMEILNSSEIYLVEGKTRGGTDRVVVFYCDQEFYEKQKPFEKFAKQYAKANESWSLWFPRFYAIPMKTHEPGSYDHVEVHHWTMKSPPNYVERSNVLLGRTIDELKVYRFLGSIRSYPKQMGGGGDPTRVVGVGQAGILAAYAALFEPSIKEVVVIDPPATHKEGPHFLGILRVLDIPEALGLLAPTPLTIIGGDRKAFERTAEIYRLAGAADKLKRK